MRASILVVFTIFAFASTQSGQGQGRGVAIQGGFSTGGEFVSVEFSKIERRYYAMGFLNGLTVLPIFGGPRSEDWVSRCLKGKPGMTDEQIAQIIYQYIANHPADWQENLNILSFQALRSACSEYLTEK
jgi:hypothetical protein